MSTVTDDSHLGILNIGSHCHSCNTIDFLPFKCDQCGFDFCSSHRLPDAHSCSHALTQPKSTPRAATAGAGATATANARLMTAKDKAATAAQSRLHRPTFSSSGASKSSSQSPSPPPKPSTPAKLAALERLKNFLGDKNGSRASSKVKATKTSPALALFDLKRSALGDASIPTNLRIYVNVTRPASEYTDAITGKPAVRPERTKALFFSKEWAVGRVLDIACTKLEVTNNNNHDADNRVALFNGKTALAYGSKFGDVVKDGASLVIKRASA